MKLRKIFVAVALLTAGLASAQQMPEVPVDSGVRIGKLDNGLTYYLRHNNNPEKKANFYIAQRVGSIQEDDSQQGLAHFLEHMAFNGSEHFPSGKMIEYLQTIGVQFGRSLNAYTSIDRTVYYIADVSTERQSALDSCVLVLRDWSSGITADPEEIEKERDVIHNEYRMRNSPSQRMIERALPTLFQGSKYGYRMPIGKMEIVDNFKPEELVAYYKKWYRPDNQALVIVGDIDVDYTENLIKRLFSDIVVPADAAKVVDEPVPDNEQAIYVAEKDKEQQYPVLMLSMKRDPIPSELKKTMAYLVTDYLSDLTCAMFNSRFSEIQQQPDCPFIQALVQDGNYLQLARTKDALMFIGVAKEGKEIETMQAVMREAKRAKDFGFTATEFARAKADYLSALEKRYTNRDKMKNEEFADSYIENFLENDPIPSVEDLYQTVTMLAQQLPFEIVNQFAQQIVSVDDKNLVAFQMEQEKEGKTYLALDAMKKAVEDVRAEALTAWVDNVKEEPLIAELPAKGKIVKETENKVLGYQELTLSNGAKVILKKTDFKDDEVMMQAEAKGGMSLFGKEDIMNLQLIEPAQMYSGLGNFSKSELDKALAGKQASVGLSVKEDRQYISGRSVPKDIETLFQLFYLTQTNIKKDEKSMASFVNQMQMVLKNKSLNHQLVYNDSLESTKNNGNPLYRLPEVEDIQKFDYDRTLQMLKQLYVNGGQFTYTVIGNFDEQTVRPLIEQYIASLPAGKAVTAKDIRTFFKGEKVNRFERQMETPQAQTTEIWMNDNLAYTLENKVLLDAASRVLTRIYLRTIREEESAAYNVGCGGTIDNFGAKPVFFLTAQAPTNPDKQTIAEDLMMKYLKECMENIDETDLSPVKETMLKQAEDADRENGHWMDVLTEWTAEGVDLQTNYAETVKALTSQKVQAFIADFIAAGNHASIVMMPEK
ncbi:MAG: insulinase family protein [Prevotella sp.]|nr:insulinase family protein [Prevotella sp.]